MSYVRKILYCSFCGKSQNEIPKLIAGPDVFICNECVAECAKIIESNTEVDLMIQLADVGCIPI